ncbi:MAG: ATP-binding protein, partial [Anaerolineae bacterium]|nr:ATP-binding protein [Anaerolineae bacterium]
VVAVRDTGYGIPPEHLPHIFEKFYRVKDSRLRHIHGTGLGLSLVKASAKAHGGYVTVDSEPEVGSVFTLYLPLYPDVPGQNAHAIRRLDLSEYI